MCLWRTHLFLFLIVGESKGQKVIESHPFFRDVAGRVSKHKATAAQDAEEEPDPKKKKSTQD